MPTVIRRSVQIKVTLSPELNAQLRELSAQLGQAPATVASMAIGEYVRTRMLQVAQMQQVAKGATAVVEDMMRDMIPEQMRLVDAAMDDELAKLLAPKKGKKA